MLDTIANQINNMHNIEENKHFKKLKPQYQLLAKKMNTQVLELQKAINDNNYIELTKLLDLDYPTDYYSLEEEEQVGLGDEVQELLQENLHELYYGTTIPRCIDDPVLLEFLAPYAIFSTKNWYFFRSIYFASTKNHKVALGYAKKVYESMQFLSEIDILINHTICNKDDQFFDEMFQLHKKYRNNCLQFNYLKRDVFELGVNVESWIKYYLFYFNDEVDKRIKNNPKYTQEDAINSIFNELLSGMENNKEIFNFLIEDYEYLIKIKGVEFIKLNLALAEKKENIYRKNLNPRRRPRVANNFHYGAQNIEQSIQLCVDKAIKNHSIDVCFKNFQDMNVPENYYISLKRAINLEQNLPPKKEDKIKKI